MVGSHKILTVSYGTFSCTLEGFEDSFGAMKAIAEYFRDLAAEDRYFGAVPPTPDAEMLARIAEKEIARRVEARLEGQGIVLRASAPAPSLMPAEEVSEPAAAPVPTGIRAAAAPQPVAEAAEPVLVRMAEASPPVTAAAAAAEPPLTAVMEAEAEAEPEAEADDGPAAPLVTAEDSAITAPVADTAPPVPVTRRVVPSRPRPMPVLPPLGAAAPLPAHPDADSVAAKLQRIRAVVGKSASPMLADAPETPLSDVANPPASLVTGEDEMEHFDPAPVAPTREIGEEAAPAFDPAPAVTLHEIAGETAPAAADDALPQGVGQRPDAEPATASPPVRARVIRMRRAEFDRAVAEGRFDPIPAATVAAAAVAAPVAGTLSPEDEEDLLAELAALRADGPAEPATSAAADQAEPDLSSLLASLAAETGVAGEAEDGAADRLDDPDDLAELARLDDLQAEADGDDEMPLPADLTDLATADAGADQDEVRSTAAMAQDDPEPQAAEADPVLSDADEPAAATADEVTDWNAVDDDDNDDNDDEVLPLAADWDAPSAAHAPAMPPAHAHLRRSADEDAAGVERLMEQADEVFHRPESQDRRAAISHLKAAVAATEAARRMGETDDDGAPKSEEAFRDDLKAAVRPRRPVSSGDQRSERPRPAPLKLVASQRVDLPPGPAPVAAGPVRPRRVIVPAETAEAPGPDARSFADFAAQMGARELPDLLEAAAAYTSFVEGVEDFSRPQLMKKVAGLSPDYNREDTMRSFGTLLREGRIMRTGAIGRFRVPDETRFHPSRAAG